MTTTKPVGPWCGSHDVHSEHEDCTGVFVHQPGLGVDTGTMFYAEAKRLNRLMPISEEERAQLEASLPPQTVENLSNELCVGAEPDAPVKTQDELLTALDELLDSALHDEACYIDANDTECVCVIGKVRASLPPCGATYRPARPQRGDRVVTCERNAHPASPDRHVF